jgi:tRNA dimethylallyltransferase
MFRKIPVICIMGPTASGKTSLAMQLFESGKYELISVDSAMVYKGLDIGSGKPTAQELIDFPHHLVDILDPSTPFDVGQFCERVQVLIQDVHARGKLPILVGGTMMYFNALQSGLADLPGHNPSIRQQLLEEAKQKGWASLYAELQRVDPDYAKKINPTDLQRIQRALEVYLQTDTPLSELICQSKAKNIYEFLNIALIPVDTPRSVLHERIKLRFESMLANGLVDEVKALYKRNDLHDDLPAIRSVGYRQVWQYLKKEITHEEMVEKSLAATRQLAKRQLTWLRSWKNCNELDFMSTMLQSESVDLIDRFIQSS